jgi:ubiquinol-cytochrome c reductase cytochrome c subunit
MRNDMSDTRPVKRSVRGARQLAAVILGALAVAGIALAAAPSSASPAGNAARGKALFVKNGCYACHGYDGQGSIYTGLRIAPNPLPWQAIAAFIRNPPGMKRPYGNWPNFVMPPFTAQMVSDQDVRDIYAYLKSVRGPAALKSIPTFKETP